MNTRMVSQDFEDGKEFSKKYKEKLSDISLHWHNCYEFDIVLSGMGDTVCNGQSFHLKRGCISFLSPMDFHEYKNCDSLKLINVQFTANQIEASLLKYFTNISSNVVYSDEKTLVTIETLCELLGNLDSEKYDNDYNRHIIGCLITSFLKCCPMGTNYNLDTELIQKAVIYINTHFCENPKMNAIANMFHLSGTYFCRIFKKCVGMTYKEYLRKLKLEYGYKLIKNTDLSITDIATASGYETQSHFNREFKKYYLAPPTSFR